MKLWDQYYQRSDLCVKENGRDIRISVATTLAEGGATIGYLVVDALPFHVHLNLSASDMRKLSGSLLRHAQRLDNELATASENQVAEAA